MPFTKGNLAAKKRVWSQDEIITYQTRIKAIIDVLGVDTVARLLDYQPQYVRLVAGYYEEQRQPSEEFVTRFARAEFLHHIRTITVPFLRERERQTDRTWTRDRVRIAKTRQKKRGE